LGDSLKIAPQPASSKWPSWKDRSSPHLLPCQRPYKACPDIRDHRTQLKWAWRHLSVERGVLPLVPVFSRHFYW
jgi:hypothetical protein